MRWPDLAEWRGPTPNRVTGGMVEWRGLVIHIAEGYYEGTIAYQKNPASQVSSHFVLDFDGKLAQVVDTDDTAWTQQAGNGHWLSVECAGFTPNPLTGPQVATIVRLFRKCHEVYQIPLQIATSPAGTGLGHHSMGTNGHSVPTDTWTGPTWGHIDCPGPNIIAQKPLIVALAINPLGVDMPAFVHCAGNGGFYAYGMGDPKWFKSTQAFNAAKAAFGNPTTVEMATLDDVRNTFGYIPGVDVDADAHGNVLPSTGGSGPAPSPGNFTITFSGTGQANPQ